MMRSDAGLHPDQAPRHIGKTSLYLATRPLLSQHDRTAIIQGYNVERVLSNIDANDGDRILCCCCGHSVLLVAHTGPAFMSASTPTSRDVRYRSAVGG